MTVALIWTRPSCSLRADAAPLVLPVLCSLLLAGCGTGKPIAAVHACGVPGFEGTTCGFATDVFGAIHDGLEQPVLRKNVTRIRVGLIRPKEPVLRYYATVTVTCTRDGSNGGVRCVGPHDMVAILAHKYAETCRHLKHSKICEF